MCSHDEAIYTVIEWCGSYWVDFECGHISGPWSTLEAALRKMRAVAPGVLRCSGITSGSESVGVDCRTFSLVPSVGEPAGVHQHVHA
jgi:hypothetical protein